MNKHWRDFSAGELMMLVWLGVLEKVVGEPGRSELNV
jgi:hypothetical protein